MFEIQGFQNNKQISIKNSKNLVVDYVSNSSKEFDNYYYNEKTKNWEKTTKNKTNNLLPYIEPIKKLKDDYIVKFKIDISNIPQLRNYSNIKWKYVGNLPTNDIQTKLAKINFHNQNIKIENEKLMILEFNLSSKTSKETLNLLLQPVFDEKDFNIATETYEKQNQLIKEVKEKRQQLLNSNNLLNSFTINKFSYQNCDIVYRFPNHTFVNATFNIGASNNPKNLEIYLISGNDNIVTKFQKDFTKFNFNPNFKNKIVGIIPKEILAVMPANEFSRMQIKSKSSVIFKLKTISNNIDNLQNFNSLIKNL